MSQQDLIPANTYNPQEVIAAAKGSLDIFGGLVMPDDCTLQFPDFYKALFHTVFASLFQQRNFDKYAIGFPRGHGKTLFLKLLILYCLFFTKKQFILIICATQELAENIIRDVWDILDSPNVRAIFGTTKVGVQKDTGHFKQWEFDSLPRILAGAGCGSSIRGFNVKNRRPDVIILDDAQTKDCASSVSEATKFLTWFTGTLMKAKAPTGCNFLYVGNMYPDLVLRKNANGENLYACQLRNLQKNKYWKSFIVGAILADGSALWEELQPITQLQEEYEQDVALGQADVFCAEVLNDPQALPNAGLDFSKIYIHQHIPGELHQGNFIIIDPATNKKNSDETAIGYFEVFDGRPILVELKHAVQSSVKTIEVALRMGFERNCRLICVESVAYQAELLNWFMFICEQQQIEGFEFLPVSPKGRSKNSRILSMIKSLVGGSIGTNATCAPALFHQIRAFNPLITTNQDDILDVVSYSEDVLLEYASYLVIAGGHVLQDYDFALLPSADDHLPAF